MTDAITKKIDRLEELRLTLRAVRAMLNQPVQYSGIDKDTETVRRQVQILRGDCAAVRDFVTMILKDVDQ